jgi:hypothetical protein
MNHLIVIFGLFLGVSVYGDSKSPLTPDSFSRVAPILTTEKNSVYSIDLGKEVYEGVVYSDLRDLRVFNSQNQMVPFGFSLKTGEEVHQTEQKELKFFPIMGEKEARYGAESHLEWRENGASGSATFKFPSRSNLPLEKRGYLIDLRKTNHPLRSLDLDWSGVEENSFVNINIESSQDLQYWSSLVNSHVLAQFKFGGESLSQKNIDLPEVKAKYLRITWQGNSGFNLRKVVGEFSMGTWTDTQRHFTKVSSATRNGLEFFYESIPVVVDRVKVFLPDPNTVVRMEISSRENNQQTWRRRFEGVVYRVSRKEGEIVSPSIKTYPSSDRFWRLQIFGKDMVVGEKTPELEMGWMSHRLFFLAHGEGPFKLAWGLEGAEQPDFGLGSIDRQLTIDGQSVQPVLANLGDMTIQKKTEKSLDAVSNPFPWKQYLLWGGLIIMLVVTGGMAYRLFKEMA